MIDDFLCLFPKSTRGVFFFLFSPHRKTKVINFCVCVCVRCGVGWKKERERIRFPRRDRYELDKKIFFFFPVRGKRTEIRDEEFWKRFLISIQHSTSRHGNPFRRIFSLAFNYKIYYYHPMFCVKTLFPFFLLETKKISNIHLA